MISMGFEYLEHTADLKVRARGKTLEEAFLNAALGAINFITDIEDVRKVETRKIRVKSRRLTSLLYDFLEELLLASSTSLRGYSCERMLKMRFLTVEGFPRGSTSSSAWHRGTA